jgi:hypothetical protein
MKATITAKEIANGIEITMGFTGNGFDRAELVQAEAKKYMADAVAAGFSWDGRAEFKMVAESPEACAPIVAFAEKNGIKIIF